MDVVRVAQPQHLPWTIQVCKGASRLYQLGQRDFLRRLRLTRASLITQQVYAQIEQGRLWELFFDQMPAGSSLCAVEPWIETIGDAETAFSMSCQLRHQPAFPDIGKVVSV